MNSSVEIDLEKDLKSQIRAIVEMLLDEFDRSSGFGQILHLLPGHDERFTKEDWWILFKRVPRLRFSLLLGSICNLVSFGKEKSGFGIMVNPRNLFKFSHASFFNDLLVWEILCEAMPFVPEALGSRIRNGAKKTLASLRGKGKLIEKDGLLLEMFSYFFPINTALNEKNLFRFLFRVMDVALSDNDATSVVYSASFRLASTLKIESATPGINEHEMLVLFLENHVYNKGKYGQGSLSYENGIDSIDSGIVTWIFEEHNEVDPTSNVNILGYLATIFPGLCDNLKLKAAVISRGIFSLLLRHSQKDDLMSSRFQQYYPQGPALFFWLRFTTIWAVLSTETKQILDGDDCFNQVNDYILAWARTFFLAYPIKFNDSDLVWASPFLEQHGILKRTAVSPGSVQVLENRLLHNAEAFHLLYPVRLICATKGLITASYLWSLIIKSKSMTRFP